MELATMLGINLLVGFRASTSWVISLAMKFFTAVIYTQTKLGQTSNARIKSLPFLGTTRVLHMQGLKVCLF
jgi:hypothetical protein